MPHQVRFIRTSPSRTMKKLTLLQVATKPRGSSMSASSAPALVACACNGAMGVGIVGEAG
jgi:hypothetical protein